MSSTDLALANQARRVSWVDRFLVALAPGWGLRRIQARAAAAAMARHYEAASIGRRTAGWYRTGGDANASIVPDGVRLRELSRTLRRDNGWARRGIATIVNNVVGWGIEAKIVGSTKAVNRSAQALWNEWAGSTACDFDGRMTFAGIQRLAMATIVESGEVLIKREPARSVDGLPVPLRVRVLEPDFIDVTKSGKGEGGGPIVGGIEFDRSGRRVAYWLHSSHPGSSLLSSATIGSERVPASDVIHAYEVERPGQVRGAPWLASAIAKLQDLDDLEDAELMQQKVAACFAAFVQDLDGAASPLGDLDSSDETIEDLEPGHIQYLPPGKTVSFATPPAAQGSGLSERALRRVAAGLGVTYEDLTGDYSKVNYSSARMARLAHWQAVESWRWGFFIPQVCAGVWRWFSEMAGTNLDWGRIPSATWTPPPPPAIDPEKEGRAMRDDVRTGRKTLFQALRELGEDPEAHLEEIAAGNKLVDKLGIVLDADPRKTTTSGSIQPTGSPASDSAEVSE